MFATFKEFQPLKVALLTKSYFYLWRLSKTRSRDLRTLSTKTYLIRGISSERGIPFFQPWQSRSFSAHRYLTHDLGLIHPSSCRL